MHWYAVMCTGDVRYRSTGLVYAECAAVARIADAGFEAFTPVVKVAFRGRGGARINRTRLEPLLRGYCFARWGDDVFSRARLRAWPEVWDVVRVGDAPRIITADEIEAIREIERAMAASAVVGDVTQAIEFILKPGDRVVHRSPVFSGFVGTVTEVTKKRIRVLFDGALSGRPFEVARQDLEAAE